MIFYLLDDLLFLMLFFLTWGPKFLSIISFHSEELPLAFLILEVGLLAINFLSFFLSESDFILPPFLEYSFTEYGILNWYFPSLSAH